MTVDELIERLWKLRNDGVKGNAKIRLYDRYGDGYIEKFELVGIAKYELPNHGGLFFKFDLRDIKK